MSTGRSPSDLPVFNPILLVVSFLSEMDHGTVLLPEQSNDDVRSKCSELQDLCHSEVVARLGIKYMKETRRLKWDGREKNVWKPGSVVISPDISVEGINGQLLQGDGMGRGSLCWRKCIQGAGASAAGRKKYSVG